MHKIPMAGSMADILPLYSCPDAPMGYNEFLTSCVLVAFISYLFWLYLYKCLRYADDKYDIFRWLMTDNMSESVRKKLAVK